MVGKGNRRLEGYEDEGFLGPINPVDESLEITVEGDLAVVKVEGEEVEAVRIEEGDDLVQVVEEIKIDYLEGKLGNKGKKGKRKLQESSGWVGFKPRKRLLEGMVMDDKVTRVTLANPGDASSYEGVVAGESRVFEVSITPSREGKVLGPIVPYWAMKYNMKPQTLLVDFDPNRMFRMQEQKSQIYNVNTEANGNTLLEARIKRELS